MTEGAILDPVARKELGGLSRRWQTYGFRTVYVGIIGFILSRHLAEPEPWQEAFSVSEFAFLAREIFAQFFWMNLALVTLASVVGAVDSIHRELRVGTLGLLLLTPLSGRGIAFGKWKAAVAQSSSLILCGLPVLGACLFLGGIGLWEIAWSVSLTVAAAALGAAFGLLFACSTRSKTAAILLSLVGLSGTVLAMVPLLLVDQEAGLALACFSHPLFAAMGAFAGAGEAVALEYGWIIAVPTSVGAGCLLVLWASAWIEERAKSPAATGRRADDISLLDRLFGRGRAGVWESRPLLWKELATRTAGRIDSEVRFWILVLLCFLLAILWTPGDGRSLETFTIVAGIFLALASVTGASLFTRDKEGRTLEVLASTPLGAWQVVRTKLASGLLAPESLPLFVLWPVVLFGWSYWAEPAPAFVFAGTATLHFAFSFVLAAASSLGARSTRGALLVTAGVQVSLLLLWPFVLETAWPWRRGRGPLVTGLLESNPAAIVSAFFSRHGARSLLDGFLPCAAAYGVAIALLLLGMVRGYRRAVIRR